jgi:predicted GNAT family acetyltransferase
VSALLGEFRAAGRGAALFVKPGNLSAMRLYARAGFEEIDDFRADYFDS